MALSTSAQLKAAIADWLHRDDLTSAIPTFIALAEADIQATLCNSPSLYQWGDATCAVGSQTISVPGMYKLVSASYQGTPLQIIQPGAIRPNNGTSGSPKFVALEGYDTLRIYPTPDDAYALDVQYVPVISPSLAGGEPDDDAANWLLQLSPGLYLFGSLIAAEGYLQDDARIQTWVNLYTKALTSFVGSKREGDLADSPDTLYIGMLDEVRA